MYRRNLQDRTTSVSTNKRDFAKLVTSGSKPVPSTAAGQGSSFTLSTITEETAARKHRIYFQRKSFRSVSSAIEDIIANFRPLHMDNMILVCVLCPGMGLCGDLQKMCYCPTKCLMAPSDENVKLQEPTQPLAVESIDVVIRQINYEDTCPLRREVLRPDLEVVFYEGDHNETSIHLGAFVANELVGVISLFQEDFGEVKADEAPAVHFPTPAGNTQWRIRGFAVAAKMRSKGLGTKLIEACIRCSKERGGRMVWCVARCTAEVVYKRQGFNRTGDVFVIEGVGRVVHMFKNI
ncbi:uncharacterized protein LOC111243378 [Varroa destructor]|uniref:N-acetyltransferase domain-containing protein n=1 Tax=Varroa destructor TaxID=109461 RepID=A0A7M7IZ40_VARDE|nr:uncharacterized protein LOC111243378 [Varroa destructor]